MVMSSIAAALSKSNRIGITFHSSPDGDSIGSSLALLQALLILKKDAYIMCDDIAPEAYSFLPFISYINNAYKRVKDNTDCVVVLDCGSYDRIAADIKDSTQKFTLINVDHHLTNQYYGDMNLVDVNASAVGEIVYKMIMSLNVHLDENMAICLYTSILTDTGGFKYSNTTSETHSIIGELISTGINFSDAHRLIFENKKYERIKLYGSVINEMYLTASGRICVMKLTHDMLINTGNKASDTSDIISIGMEIDTVEVAVLLKEVPEGIKISIRSKSLVDVRKIAELFGGGGHTRAAGLSMNKHIDEAEKIIINLVEKELV